VSKATSAAKIAIMVLKLEKQLPEDTEGGLTGGALTFYKKYMKKVRACLDFHFKEDDVEGVCQAYPDFFSYNVEMQMPDSSIP